MSRANVSCAVKHIFAQEARITSRRGGDLFFFLLFKPNFIVALWQIWSQWWKMVISKDVNSLFSHKQIAGRLKGWFLISSTGRIFVKYSHQRRDLTNCWICNFQAGGFGNNFRHLPQLIIPGFVKFHSQGSCRRNILAYMYYRNMRLIKNVSFPEKLF